MLRSLLPIAQIVISVLLVTVVLLQPSSAGIGGAFGGSDGAQAFRTKRGFEKFLFIATIVLGVVFAGLCVLAIVL
jgi:protein translocase SecG subunit